jgi:cell division protein FtsW (lipid II flippase)
LWRNFVNKKNGHGVAAAAASSTCCAAILLLCALLLLSLEDSATSNYYFDPTTSSFFLNAARQKTFLGTFSCIGMLVYLFICAFLQFAFWSSADRAG